MEDMTEQPQMEAQIQHLLGQIATLQGQIEASRIKESTSVWLKLSKLSTYSRTSRQEDVCE